MEKAKKILDGIAIVGMVAALAVVMVMPNSDFKTLLGRLLLLGSAAIFAVGSLLDFFQQKQPGSFTAQDGARLGTAIGVAVIVAYGLYVTLS